MDVLLVAIDRCSAGEATCVNRQRSRPDTGSGDHGGLPARLDSRYLLGRPVGGHAEVL